MEVNVRKWKQWTEAKEGICLTTGSRTLPVPKLESLHIFVQALLYSFKSQMLNEVKLTCMNMALLMECIASASYATGFFF